MVEEGAVDVEELAALYSEDGRVFKGAIIKPTERIEAAGRLAVFLDELKIKSSQMQLQSMLSAFDHTLQQIHNESLMLSGHIRQYIDVHRQEKAIREEISSTESSKLESEEKMQQVEEQVKELEAQLRAKRHELEIATQTFSEVSERLNTLFEESKNINGLKESVNRAMGDHIASCTENTREINKLKVELSTIMKVSDDDSQDHKNGVLDELEEKEMSHVCNRVGKLDELWNECSTMLQSDEIDQLKLNEYILRCIHMGLVEEGSWCVGMSQDRVGEHIATCLESKLSSLGFTEGASKLMALISTKKRHKLVEHIKIRASRIFAAIAELEDGIVKDRLHEVLRLWRKKAPR